MKRNPSIELWRCLCMFAVVLGHVVVHNQTGTMNGFLWHIPGFLLITGYFGIKFKWAKVFRLLGICYACYWLTIPLRDESVTLLNLLVPHGGWFVPFYIVLMMLSPILNAAISAGEHRRMAMMVGALLLFAWCPCFWPRLGMMRVAGLQGNGMLLMVATYILGRLFAEHGVLNRIKPILGGCVFLAGIALQVVVYGYFPEAGSYVAPLSLITAFAGFSVVANIRLPEMLVRPVVFIAPSMFGVYLLHECCIKSWQYSDFAARSWWHSLVWAAALFSVSILIDLVRRVLTGLAIQLAIRSRLIHEIRKGGR